MTGFTRREAESQADFQALGRLFEGLNPYILKEESAMNKRGRPAKEDSKRGQYRLRMSKEDEAMLDFISKELKRNKAEALRFAIKFMYDALKL